MSEPRIVVIGAAGQMTSVAVQRLSSLELPASMELYDLDTERLEPLSATLPRPPARMGSLDLFDTDRLRGVIDGGTLVILGAGPYHRTAAPVMRACVERGVPYIDIGDDIESTLEAFAVDADARAAGVALLVGCGASPGFSNLLAVDAVTRLDEVETLDVCWVTGDEGARPYGAAVIEHIFHIGAGPCLTWREGKAATVETFVATDIFPLGGDIGDYRLYETAHPEAATLPRRFPRARSIRVMGGGHPQPFNGAIRGVSLAVRDGKLSVKEATEWFQAVLSDRNGSLRGWRYALAGMLGQVRRRESTLAELGRFLRAGIRKEHIPFRAAVLVRATGTRKGQPATVVVRTPTGGPESPFAPSMGMVTGTCLAAFALLALERRDSLAGALAPEDWLEPEALYAGLQRFGIPRDAFLASDPVAA